MPEHKDVTGADLHIPGPHSHTNLSGIQYMDVQLNNAQIKALPTTSVTLVAAPGLGTTLMFHRALLLVDKTEAWYTNVDADAVVYIGTGGYFNSENIVNGNGTPYTEANDLLSDSTATMIVFIGTEAVTLDAYGQTLAPSPRAAAVLDNNPIQLSASNGSSSNFTGGHINNTLSIRVWYSIVPTVPFGGA